MPHERVKQLEAEIETLKEIRQRYETLTSNMPLGLYRRTPGPDGKLIMVNPALVRLFGYSSSEDLHQVPVVNLYFNPEECLTFSSKLFADKEIIREQLKMKRADGTPVWISVTATVICDNNGEPRWFDGIMEDITTAKMAEEEALLRQQQLLQADKMISLGILVSGVAHEINNPNQFIVSHASPLRRIFEDARPVLDRYYQENGDFKLGGNKYSTLKDRIAEMFNNIDEGTDRIQRIVEELRDYAREQPTERIETVDLNRVVVSALSLLKNLIKKSTRAFYVTYDRNIPPFRGDYHRIEQVVINLVQNACQSFESDPGEISIITTCREDLSEVMVQVNDTGVGISPENMRRLRDPFFTTKRGLGGTGLGLSISDTIMSRHGGRLEFQSEPGQGTTVKMILPASHPTGDSATR